jgi:hypothetical protein
MNFSAFSSFFQKPAFQLKKTAEKQKPESFLVDLFVSNYN